MSLTTSLVVQAVLSRQVRQGLNLDRRQGLLNVHAVYVVYIVVFQAQVVLSMLVRQGLTQGRRLGLQNAQAVCVVSVVMSHFQMLQGS